jgi:dTDP-glucose 4,6-dehydratase
MIEKTQAMLVTGGAGFIGSNFVRLALERTGRRIVVLDKLTYAGSLESLREVQGDPRFRFERGDIADRARVREVFRTHQPTSVVNFAAESHVDRSIDGPRDFVETNLLGTFEMLEASRHHLAELPSAERDGFRFLHVSTDEVYGSLGPDGYFTETTPYAPNSPYSASKAGGDHLVRAYQRTYDLPTLTTNCSNNYGPYQFPEKLIPLMILNAIEAKPLPIYGDGGNIRDWLYVEDHCEGILTALERGRSGEQYAFGGACERTNLEIVDQLCAILDGLLPPSGNPSMRERGLDHYADLKSFVEDRPGHDRRYAIDASKVRSELGWKPRHDLDGGLRQTVHWYLEHREWCEAVQRDRYGRERLGLSGEKP